MSLMNHTSDQEIVTKKMKETFEYRQSLIHNPDKSHTVLTVFPRLLDTKGLVSCFKQVLVLSLFFSMGFRKFEMIIL